MNKKELAEIKKNFGEHSGFFTLNRVLTAYIDTQKNVRCQTNELYSLTPEEIGAVLMESLSKVFKGSLGKGLLEYPFPREQYDEGGSQRVLWEAVKTKLADETACAALLEKIINNLAYEPAYTIIIGHCSYSIMSRDRNDDDLGTAADEYNFIVCAVCPAVTNDDGLMFDGGSNSISKKSNTELVIAREPTDGFFYPVFSDRAPDVNSVMYFTKTPRKPNVSFVNDVLGCEFRMSANGEKKTFQQVMHDVCGDELNYTVITQVNEKLREFVQEAKNDTELPVVDGNRLYNILSDSGVSDEKLEGLKTIFENKVSGGALTATNLVEPKTKLSTPEITVSISKDATDKVRTTTMDGRRCLIIDLDDPAIEINGLATRIKGNTI